jgi:uncharacterized protein (DUF58 family)
MRWRSDPGRPEKRERAELLLLALSALLLRGGERVRLLGGGPRAFMGRPALEPLAQQLSLLGDDPALPAADPSLPRHARAVLIGDFLAPLAAVQQAVTALAARPVRGHLLQVLDPAEESLPWAGRIRFEGLEAEAPALVPRVEAVRELYAERLKAHREGLAAIAAAAGWGFITHRTDHSPEAALLALWQALAPR